MPEPTPLRPRSNTWPDPPNEAVYHGLAGEIVRALDPHTEADPVGVLVSLLAAFGNALGTRPHLILDNATHGLRLWPVLVGPTGTGRKGTALAVAGTILGRALPEWWGQRGGGLSTGEGLIWDVRDAISVREPIKVKGTVVDYQDVITDPGVSDKRRFLVESEFGGVLQVLARDKNNLSAILRKAWDGEPMTTMTKGSYTRATGAHITITGHITPEEVRELLGARETTNGLGNRFLWVCVRRSKLLPLGGQPDEATIVGLAAVVERTVEAASTIERFTLDDEATAAWVRVYGALANDEAGAVGQLTSRGAPSIMRLAGIYAALDLSAEIQLPHLEAALALWGYSEESVRHIFGGSVAAAEPVKTVPDEPQRRAILDFLVAGVQTKTAISVSVFARNLDGRSLTALLAHLVAEGLIEETKARPASGIGPPVYSYALTARGREAVSG